MGNSIFQQKYKTCINCKKSFDKGCDDVFYDGICVKCRYSKQALLRQREQSILKRFYPHRFLSWSSRFFG